MSPSDYERTEQGDDPSLHDAAYYDAEAVDKMHAELLTLRARVKELEDKLAGPRTIALELAPLLAEAITPQLADALTSRLKAAVTFGDAAPLTPAEAADLLHLSQSTLEQWRLKGLGPKWIKLGTRSVGYPIAELKKYLTRGDAPAVSWWTSLNP